MHESRVVFYLLIRYLPTNLCGVRSFVISGSDAQGLKILPVIFVRLYAIAKPGPLGGGPLTAQGEA